MSPYIFIIYHADITTCVGAFSTHLYADDLCTLITPPIQKKFGKMIKFINEAGSRVCQKLSEYSRKWKQPINISKTVVQIFHSQVKRPQVEVVMDGVLLEVVRTFKYLGFTWTDKLSLKPTVDNGLQNIQKSFIKLKWLKRNKDISTAVLRTCFFAYSFPFFNWIFPFFPLLQKSQQKATRQKFRSGLRLIHQCPFVEANDIYIHTKEKRSR